MKHFLRKIKNKVLLAHKAGGTIGSKLKLLWVSFRIPLFNKLSIPNRAYSAWIGSQTVRTRVRFEGTYDELLLLYEIFVAEQYKVPAECKRTSVIDLGANAGLSAIYYAVQCPQAIIYAYEANPILFTTLVQNVSGISRIKAFNAAIQGHDAPEVSFFVDAKKSIASSLTQRTNTMQQVTVPGISLNTVLATLNTPVDILKIDVEGAEFGIFDSLINPDRINYIVGELHEDIAGISSDGIVTKLKKTHNVTTKQAGHQYRILLYATAH